MKKVYSVLKYGFLGISSFLSIFPFIWMVMGATNTSTDITMGKLSFGSNFSTNLATLASQVDLVQGFCNSMFIAIATTAASLFLCSLAGYAFEVYRTKLLDRIFSVVMLSMMIPFAAVMIPLFTMISKMGFLNSYAGVVLPTTVTAFLIFFFMQKHFVEGMVGSVK